VIMDISDIDHLHVELTVYENDISRVAEGQKIWFNVSSDPETQLEAEIYLLGSAVREDRSITVHAHLLEKVPYLLPGMYVSAEIQTERSDVMTLPENSIVRFDGKHYVFQYFGEDQENDVTIHHFDMIEVEKGITQNGSTAIQFPNMEISKSQFVISGAFTLLASTQNSEGGGHH